MSVHPSFERMRAVASALGSTATTVRGVAKFLWDCSPKVRGPAVRRAVCGVCCRTNDGDWKAAVAKRKSDPDAKRARDDVKFRENYLRRLRRREQVAQRFDATTLTGVIQRIDSNGERMAELTEVARLRSIALGKPQKVKELPKVTDVVLLPRIQISETAARKLGATIIMRGKDATLGPCWARSHGNHQDAYTDWSKGLSKPRGVRATHDNRVRSFGMVINPQRLDAVFHETIVTVVLPEGYQWDHDDNHALRAVFAESRRDDYHPDASDLLAKDAAGRIVALLQDNRRRRQEYEARVTVEKAAVEGVYVCLADSLRAGNCRAGTLAFAQRHGLSETRHYSAPELLVMANGDASRVRLAVTAARLRHEREMAAGVCELADHKA